MSVLIRAINFVGTPPESPHPRDRVRRDSIRVMAEMRKAEDDETYCDDQKRGIRLERRVLESLYNDRDTPDFTLEEALKLARMRL